MGDSTEEESVEEEVGQAFVEDQGKWADTPWEECIDDSGNVYYYNAETGDSSWDLPQEFRSVLKDTEVTVIRRDSQLLAKVPTEETVALAADVEKISKENEELLLQVALLRDQLVATKASALASNAKDSKYEEELNATKLELKKSSDDCIRGEVACVLECAVSATEVGHEREARKTAEAQVASTVSQMAALERDCERLEEELEDTRDERTNSEQWLDKLRMELFEYEEALNGEREKKDELLEQVGKLEKEKAQFLAQDATVEEERKSEQDNLLEQLKTKDSQIAKLAGQVSALEDKVSSHKTDVEAQQKALDAKGVEISKLNRLLEQEKQQASEQGEQFKEQAEQEAERSELQQKVETLEESVKNLEQKIADEEESKRRAEQALADATLAGEELAAKVKASEELRDDLTKAIEKIATLEESVKLKEGKLKDMEGISDESLKQAEQKAAEVSASLRAATDAIDEKQASIDRLLQDKEKLAEAFRKHQVESEKQIVYMVKNFNSLREEHTLSTLSDDLLQGALFSSIIEISEEKYDILQEESKALKLKLEDKALSASLLQKHEEASRDAQKQQLQEQLSRAVEKLEKQKLAENLLREENALLSKNLNDTSSVVESLQRQYEEARQKNKAAETELANAARVAQELDEEVKYLTEQKKKLSHAVIATKAEAVSAAKNQLVALQSECKVIRHEARALKSLVEMQISSTIERFRTQAETMVRRQRSVLGNGRPFSLIRCVRLRPKRLNGPWSTSKEKAFVTVENDCALCLQKSPEKSKTWVYDSVFSTQKSREIFEQLRMADAVDQLSSSSGKLCILCYGQSKCGKTHSIYGNVFDPGLLTVAMEHIEQERINVRISARRLFGDEVTDLSIDALDRFAGSDAKNEHYVYTLGFENGSELSFVDLADSGRISRKVGKKEKQEKLKTVQAFESLRAAIRSRTQPFGQPYSATKSLGALSNILGLRERNSRPVTVVMLVHISSELMDADESCCTLNYGASLV